MKNTTNKFDKQKAIANVLAMVAIIKAYKSPPVVDHWDKDGLLYSKFSWSENNYVEFGYIKYPRGKIAHFVHCRKPMKYTLLQEAQKLINSFVTMFPAVEVFYDDDDFVRDFNNGKMYDPVTHKVVKEFYSSSPTRPLEVQIGVYEGSATNSKYKSRVGDIDFDSFYANL
jgi:hypothetical protein